MKQMRELYGQALTEEERRQSKSVVHGNIVAAIAALLQYCDDQGYELEATEEADQFREMYMKDLDTDELATVQLIHDVNLDERKGALVDRLWNDPAIQRAFSERGNFHVTDSIR